MLIGQAAQPLNNQMTIYHNVGIYNWSDIDVALDKGGNAHTLTRNNAADKMTGNVQYSDVASNNFFGNPRMSHVLRDPDNWDFRPRPEHKFLIDQGVLTQCSVNGQDIPSMPTTMAAHPISAPTKMATRTTGSPAAKRPRPPCLCRVTTANTSSSIPT